MVSLKDKWPDYVFEKNYQLMPLPELKNFIQLNNHLPGIPSSKEIESKGIDLEHMSTLMLEKIEELTLHIIRLHERLERIEEND